MIKHINAKITTLSPTFIGGDKKAGNINLPYFIHVPHDKSVHAIDREKLETFIKCLGAFYRNCEKTSFGSRSFSEAFRDRVLAALCTPSISQFFTTLAAHLPIAESAFYQYTTQFVFGLTKSENLWLLNWARQNIDLFVAASIYQVESYKFKEDFKISDDLLQIEYDYLIPVIPGNSLRGLMRDQTMSHVIETVYGADPHKVLTPLKYHTLFSGGLLTDASGFVNIEAKRAIREALPFLSILGTMHGNESLPGKIDVNFAIPQCYETNHEIDRSGWSYLKEYHSVRIDDYEGIEDEKWLELKKKQPVQMYYSTLALQKGVDLDWSIDQKYLSVDEQAALDFMLYIFRETGDVGGMNSKGFGKIQVEYFDYEPNPAPMTAWLETHKADIKKTIDEVL